MVAAASCPSPPTSLVPGSPKCPSEDRQCRICFEGEHEGTSTATSRSRLLLSPCECKGSQKFVHADCLMRWQSILWAKQEYAKAYYCSVCKSRYTYPSLPFVLVRHVSTQASKFFKFLVAFISVVWFIPVTLLFKSVLFLATICLPMSLLSFSGYSIAFVGPNNQPMFIRSGSPISGLQGGCLLVASRSIPSTSIFYKAVILLVDHNGQFGSKGLVLNKPATDVPVHGGGVVNVSLGGPVDQWSYSCLHSMPLARSRRIADGVYLTEGSGSPEFREVRTARNHTDPHQVPFRSRMLQGYAGWAPTQLAGEVRAGVWHFIPAVPERVFIQSPENMWEVFTQMIEGRADGNEVLTSAPLGVNVSAIQDQAEPQLIDQDLPNGQLQVNLST